MGRFSQFKQWIFRHWDAGFPFARGRVATIRKYVGTDFFVITCSKIKIDERIEQM